MVQRNLPKYYFSLFDIFSCFKIDLYHQYKVRERTIHYLGAEMVNVLLSCDLWMGSCLQDTNGNHL